MLSLTLLFGMIILKDGVISYRFGTQNGTNNRSGGYPKFPQSFLITNAENKFVNDFYYSNKQTTNMCGTRSINFNPKRFGKIIGGYQAPYGSYPWQVEIQIYNYEKGIFEHHCGAAVIGERLVLTAAHCTEVFNKIKKNPIRKSIRIEFVVFFKFSFFVFSGVTTTIFTFGNWKL